MNDRDNDVVAIAKGMLLLIASAVFCLLAIAGALWLLGFLVDLAMRSGGNEL